MRCRRRGINLGVGVFIVSFFLIAFSFFLANDTFAAGGKYYQKYDQCVADSGRGHINTVVERCRVANNDSVNNQCALWIGPIDNSSTTTIVANVSGNQTSVPFKYWGMCTDGPAGTSSIQVIGSGSDAFSIPDSSTQGTHNKWRNIWGNPGSLDGTIDVNKFKNGATVTDLGGGNYAYSRTVTVKRCNDQNVNSCGNEDVYVTLQTGGSTPGPSDSSCPGIAAPSGYSASGTKQGWSSVRTQVQKNNGGFTAEVFVKPGDNVNWRHCYFPGVQKVAGTYVTTSHPHPVNISNANDTIHPYTNKPFSSAVGWGNSYKILNKDNNSSELSYGVGSYDVRRTDNSYRVEDSWVGSSLAETSSLSSGPWSVSAGDAHNCSWDCVYKKDSVCNEQKNVSYHCETTYPINGYQSGKPVYGAPVTTYSSCTQGIPSNLPGGCNCTKKETVQVACQVDEWTKCSHGNNGIVDYSTCSNNNGCMKAGDKSSETATVRVPYNFNLNSSVKIKTDVVYAGESASLTDAKIWSSEKSNGATGGTYRTNAPVVKGQFVTFIARDANGSNRVTGEIGSDIMTKNGGFSYNEGAWGLSDKQVNVQDTQAGLYFCVALKVYPSNSGADTNWNNREGSGSWGTSGIDCKIIAKRPSFQVWGGNIFSNGKIQTSTAIKNNGNGLPYKVMNHTNELIYGSWGELGVTALGTNTGLASGNSLYNYGTGVLKSKSGLAFCNVESILSFANYAYSHAFPICGGGSSSATGAFGIGVRNTNKQSIIDDIIVDNTVNNCNGAQIKINGDHFESNVSVKSVTRVTPNDTMVQYLYCNDAVTINNSAVGFGQTAKDSVVRNVGTTWIIRSNNDITINENIGYISPSGGYSKFIDMQKLIIYSKKNIKISCNVSSIDAILIAEENINTCYNAPNNDNASERNGQFRLNGAIIANNLTLGRSFGSGGGVYPALPAEIINHDSSLLLWGRAQADASDSNKAYTTYTRELAPRY